MTRPGHFEGAVSISLTAPSLAGRIAEAREQLDTWLSTLSPPPAGQVQALRLVGLNPLTYEVTLRPQVNNESRMVLL
jgi:hypothetical protein